MTFNSRIISFFNLLMQQYFIYSPGNSKAAKYLGQIQGDRSKEHIHKDKNHLIF